MTGTTALPYLTLHKNSWVSLRMARDPARGVNGYVYSHETRCQGRIVAVLPYQDAADGQREYLVKSEMTPCWGSGQVLSAITGGYEGADIEDDAVREMLEETGYAITGDELIPLGESFASKSADTVYSLFSVNLTGRMPGEAIGDGTRLEAESEAVWVDADRLATLKDPQLAVMHARIVSADAMTASVPAGELAAFGNLMEKTQGVLASLRTQLDTEVAAERERADKAEAELAALEDRISVVIAKAVADERGRAERAESALSDALLRLAHGDAELHARLLADAGYESLPDCGGRETEASERNDHEPL